MENTIAKIVLKAIFLVVFNLFFFLFCGMENVASVWISYALIHVAYLFILLMPFFNRGNRGQTILSTTLYSVAIGYFLIELLIGTIFICVAPESITWALLIQVTLFALFLFVFLSSYMANNSTRASMEGARYESLYVKEASSRLELLMKQVTDREVAKRVEKCYDLLRSSPIHSHGRVKMIEESVMDGINDLRTAVMSGDKRHSLHLADTIRMQIEERNNLLRTLNKQ